MMRNNNNKKMMNGLTTYFLYIYIPISGEIKKRKTFLIINVCIHKTFFRFKNKTVEIKDKTKENKFTHLSFFFNPNNDLFEWNFSRNFLLL